MIFFLSNSSIYFYNLTSSCNSGVPIEQCPTSSYILQSWFYIGCYVVIFKIHLRALFSRIYT